MRWQRRRAHVVDSLGWEVLYVGLITIDNDFNIHDVSDQYLAIRTRIDGQNSTTTDWRTCAPPQFTPKLATALNELGIPRWMTKLGHNLLSHTSIFLPRHVIEVRSWLLFAHFEVIRWRNSAALINSQVWRVRHSGYKMEIIDCEHS